MKESLLDVFMYLLDHWLVPGGKTSASKRHLKRELEEVGFDEEEIEQALSWLSAIEIEQATHTEHALETSKAFRQFLPEELRHISTKARGFLLSLEQARIIDVSLRENIIDRLMELDVPRVSPAQCKWVTAMVMFSAKDNMPSQMEELLFYEHHQEVMH